MGNGSRPVLSYQTGFVFTVLLLVETPQKMVSFGALSYWWYAGYISVVWNSVDKMNFEKIKEHSFENLGEGTPIKDIEKLEALWSLKFPLEFKTYLEEIGYAEIFGDEIFSIYEIPDETPCLGLYWMNKDNEHLHNGFMKFFSNDIDGDFYIHSKTGKVYNNSINSIYTDSFLKFIDKILK